MNSRPIPRTPLVAATMLAGCALAACGATGGAPTAVSTHTGRAATAASTATATPSPSPTPAPTPTPSPPPAPATPAAVVASPAHHSLAACRLVDAATAAAMIGSRVTKDETLSGFVTSDWFSVSDGTPYAQDDCAYTAGAGTVRVVLVEPAPPHRATAADGHEAFQATEGDLTDHGVAVSPLTGVGDEAAISAAPGGGEAQVIVRDHEVVFDVSVETAADATSKAVALALETVSRADSGAANGQPGS